MPKMIAPHGASFRGRTLVAGEIVDVTDAEALHLAAHAFRLADASTKEQDSTGTAGVTPAFTPPTDVAADKMSAVPVESSIPEMAAAIPDVATIARKDLLKLLKGRHLGNLFVKPTDELRALAAIVLAGEKIAEAGDGDE